jgi:hypothetical protein
MAAELARCGECDSVRNPAVVPSGWWHHTRRDDRLRIWPSRCPLCAMPTMPSVPVDDCDDASTEATATPAAPNPKLDMANLEAMWAYAPTQRERSVIEGQMWETFKDSVSKLDRKHGCAKWLARRLGDAIDNVADRLAIRRYDAVAGALWARVDGSERMLVRAASQILSRARVRATSESTSVRDAIDAELVEYDKGLLIVTPKGTFRRKAMRPRPNSRLSGPKPGKTKNATDLTMARELWMAVRASVKRVVDHELRGISSARTRDLLRDQSEVEIETTIRMLQSRVNRARENPHLDAAPAAMSAASMADERKTLKRACEALGVDPPGSKERVTYALYKSAKNNYRKLAREYHPDHGGTAERFDAVTKAMQSIEDAYQAANDQSATKTSTNNESEKEP